MAQCPHCSEGIESLEGFVPRAAVAQQVKDRLSPVMAERDRLAEAYQASQAKVSELTPLAESAASLQQEIEKRDQFQGDIEVLTGLGVANPASVLDDMRLMYDARTTGMEDRPDFGAWLDSDGRNHALLSHMFAAPAAAESVPGAETVQPAAAPAARRSPIVAPGGAPPPPSKMTQGELDAALGALVEKGTYAEESAAVIERYKVSNGLA